MTTYQELLKQREALDAQIAEVRKGEFANAVSQARQLVQEFGLTAQDIFGGARQSKVKGTTVAPKFRDPATGATWTGRGKPPLWIAGKDRAQFAIA
jgi:DNA-binding protein H-NS